MKTLLPKCRSLAAAVLAVGILVGAVPASGTWVYNAAPSSRPDAVMPGINDKQSPVANLSTRGFVGTGENVLVAGIVVQTRSNFLIRAVGPGLTQFNITGVLSNPKIELNRSRGDGTSEVIATNTNWTQAVPQTGGPVVMESIMRSVGAFDLSRTSNDAALYVQLAPGNYTAVVKSNNGGSGVALLETYLVKPEIDPFDPAWRSASVNGYTTEGLAPPAPVADLYGVRLELHDSAAMTITYTPADYPDSRNWNGNSLPLTKTYGKDWVLPVMAYHGGGRPIGESPDAFWDSQGWGDSLPFWKKTGPNTVQYWCASGTSEVTYPYTGRVVTLTFTSPNSGTYLAEVGLLAGMPTRHLSKVHATTTGTFIFNRISQIVPTSDSNGPYTGFWVE